MAQLKKEKYNKDDLKLAECSRALAHPARIAILRQLLRKNCFFNEISDEIPLANSTISQHLTELKIAGLIKGSSEPPKVRYSVNLQELKVMRKLLKGLVKGKVD